MTETTVTIPVRPELFWTLAGFTLVVIFSLIVFWALSGIGPQRRTGLIARLTERNGFFAILAFVVVAGLFLGALAAAAFVLAHTIGQALNPDAEGPNLGAGALIAALLGAPFVIWGTWLKYQTVRYQKEGHMTDRINTAVEQLGAEKTVERLGRSVTIWTGPTRETKITVEGTEAPSRPKRAKEIGRQSEWIEDGADVVEGTQIAFRVWSSERVVIQFLGEPLNLTDEETIGGEGEWTAFGSTESNIEVRIGAILSLERIAQDSTTHDKGRDHVRVMEILCAYVRENARTKSLAPTHPPFSRATPRLDIQLAINVLGKRSLEQIAIERSQKFRLDLSGTNLDGVDFSKKDFSAAIFQGSRLEASDFSFADLTGTRFFGALLNFGTFRKAKMYGSRLDGAVFSQAKFGGLSIADIHGLSIEGADVTGLHFSSKNADEYFGSRDTKVSHGYEIDKVQDPLILWTRPDSSSARRLDHEQPILADRRADDPSAALLSQEPRQAARR